jgi:Transglutaminase-like superfamily
MQQRRSLLWLLLGLLPACAAAAALPALNIDENCEEVVPLYEALPINDTFVTDLVRREGDGLIIGAACGKQRICLFSFDADSAEVRLLDSFEAPWWDEPRLSLSPNGDIYLGARRAHDKQFAFERLRERSQTPDSAYKRRDAVPAPHEVNEEAEGMAIRHYSPAGALLDEIPLPESLALDGVGALAIVGNGETLCGLSSPGGHLFTVSLPAGEARDHGEVTHFPQHHHARPICKVLMQGDDGQVYFAGRAPEAEGDGDDVTRSLLAFNPADGKIRALDVRLPAVKGRGRFAAVDAAVQLDDGSFLGGTNDGYLFRFDAKTGAMEGFGKPLRQGRICGLAMGPDGVVYGAGGEPGGLPRLFAFDPAARRLYLGGPPSGSPPEQSTSTFGDIGAIVCTADGTLVCGERERRGFLLLYRPEGQRLMWQSTMAGDDFAECVRDRFITVSDDGVAELAPTFLVSDVPARSSKVKEILSETVYARKLFRLPSPCREAELLFFGGGGTAEDPMTIRVNGHETTHVQDRERMLTGGWDRATIPGEYLRTGRNEIVFGGAGHLLIDADASRGASSKREGEEGPWRSGILGPDNDIDGEYVVRMRVRGRPAKGQLTSPVIDLAQIAAGEKEAALPPSLRVNRVRLRAEATTPPGTSVRLEIRSGSTPLSSPATWSEWRPANTMGEDASWGRFVQWRATLTTGHSDTTPHLRRVTVAAAGEPSGANGEQVHVALAPDNAVAVSSYRFDYADPNQPRMRYLRDKYALEEVVAPGNTEAEKFALLRQWVREQWEGWNANKYDYCPQWDALEILEMAPANLGLGMCTHYAAVFVQCAASLGYHGRVLIVDHHCLAEVWSDQYSKWILQDPGLIPGHAVALQYEVDGVPINALEMHQRALAGNADDVQVVPDPPRTPESMRDQMVQLYCRFGIPLRNDHLYRPEPQELEHGNDQYHWDGYLWWTDSLDPRYPEYSLLTNRPEDFYWTVNKTLITVEDTDTPGELSVHLSGPTPNRARFMVRMQEGQWQQSNSSFRWVLAPGKNALEARAVNSMGIEGLVNRVEVDFASP